jgi:hypothetical protein
MKSETTTPTNTAGHEISGASLFSQIISLIDSHEVSQCYEALTPGFEPGMLFLNHHRENVGSLSSTFSRRSTVVPNGNSLTRFSSGENRTEQNTRNGPVWSILGQYKPQVSQPSLLERHRPAVPGGGRADAPPAGVPLLRSAERFSAPLSSLIGLLPQ